MVPNEHSEETAGLGETFNIEEEEFPAIGTGSPEEKTEEPEDLFSQADKGDVKPEAEAKTEEPTEPSEEPATDIPSTEEKEEESTEFTADNILDPDTLRVKTEEEGINYEDIAKELEIQIDETGIKTKDALVSALQKKLESNKQKVEFNLEKFDPYEQKVIKFIAEHEGDLESLIRPAAQIDDFLRQSPEEKLTEIYTNQGKTPAQVADVIEDLQTRGELDNEIKKIDAYFIEQRNQVIDTAIKDAGDRAEVLRQKNELLTQAEKSSLKEQVGKINEFMGVKLTDKWKAHLLSEIESGKLQSANNIAEAQLNARLFTLLGSEILKTMELKVKDANREGYNNADKKASAERHQVPPKNISTGSESSVNSDVRNKLKDFENIEEKVTGGGNEN